MAFNRRPTFGLILLGAMLLFCLANLLVEKTSVGKWLMGRRHELFPMSTFSVFLHRRLTGAQTYAFRVFDTKADQSGRLVRLSAMFHPLKTIDLEDEVTYQQLAHLERSILSRCPTYQAFWHDRCLESPSALFRLPPDLQQTWTKSLGHTPYRITFIRLRWSFNPDTGRQVQGPKEIPVMAFYPQPEGRPWLSERI